MLSSSIFFYFDLRFMYLSMLSVSISTTPSLKVNVWNSVTIFEYFKTGFSMKPYFRSSEGFRSSIFIPMRHL